jgi:hypothetical protein
VFTEGEKGEVAKEDKGGQGGGEDDEEKDYAGMTLHLKKGKERAAFEEG